MFMFKNQRTWQEVFHNVCMPFIMYAYHVRMFILILIPQENLNDFKLLSFGIPANIEISSLLKYVSNENNSIDWPLYSAKVDVCITYTSPLNLTVRPDQLLWFHVKWFYNRLPKNCLGLLAPPKSGRIVMFSLIFQYYIFGVYYWTVSALISTYKFPLLTSLSYCTCWENKLQFWFLKPGSHLRHKHKHKQHTQTQ